MLSPLTVTLDLEMWSVILHWEEKFDNKLVKASTRLQEKICSQHDKTDRDLLSPLTKAASATCACWIKHKGHRFSPPSCSRENGEDRVRDYSIRNEMMI
ncbi:hypothetical protein NFI96_027178 [Prochilodus magdalenae]|nr:hypothetical protein NFI96_027178 [Prochilodus magdalenae]